MAANIRGARRGTKTPPRPGGGSERDGKNPAYFSDHKKGEVNELKNLLRNISVERDQKRKREIIKKVIAYMTLGIDVSRLFSEMVMCVDTKDMVLKKMVYQYLTNYAATNSDLAILCINTLLRDCRHEDPMVRGLALRSLCSLRLESILEYIHDPLQNSLTDTSAYVRKTGVMGILKVFGLNQQLVKDSDMIDTLYNMLRDRDANVVGNCIIALNEIMADEGGMAINQQIITHLLNRIVEFNEWGQCAVLELVARYEPENDEETFSIMNIMETCLRVSNSAVVLAAAKCFIALTEKMPNFHWQVFNRLKQPLLTLMAGGSSELTYCVLHHILQMALKQPGVFDDEYRQFYARYNEPSHLKYVKVETLAAVANEENVAEIVRELSEYVTDVDQELARRSIRSIAHIAVKIEPAANAIVDSLLEFLEMDTEYVRGQTVIVMKDLLRKYPEDRHDVLPFLPRVLRKLEDPEAKAAAIWMVGEFGEDLREAPYILEPLIDQFSDEKHTTVALELITAIVKLFFKRPPEVQSMLGRLLHSAIVDSLDAEIRDRGLLYYRLLQQNVQRASEVVNCKKEPIEQFAEERDNDVKDKVFREFNSLSVVYGKPSETFIVIEMARAGSEDEEEDDEEDEEGEEEAANYDEDYLDENNNRNSMNSRQKSSKNGSQQNIGGLDDEPDEESTEDAYGGKKGRRGSGKASPASAQGRTNNMTEGPGGDLLLDMDLLGGDSGENDFHGSPSVDALPLNSSPGLDAESFQRKWTQLMESAKVNVHVGHCPQQAEIETALSSKFIFTMASGDIGPQYKFFFYAQDLSGCFYLVECLFDKSRSVAECTIKSDVSANGGVMGDKLKQVFSQI